MTISFQLRATVLSPYDNPWKDVGGPGAKTMTLDVVDGGVDHDDK